MTKLLIETLLILASELFFISANLSQLIKLFKTRNRKGLSAVNQSLNASGNAAWATYFITQQRFLPTVTNVIMFLITLTTLGFTLSDKARFYRGIAAVIMIGGAIALAITYFPEQAGWISVICNAIAITPWITHIVRTKKTSGISEKSLYFGMGAILCTLIYALLIQSVPLLAGSAIGLTGNLVVLSCYYRYRKF